MEHTFPSASQRQAFDDDMEKRTKAAAIAGGQANSTSPLAEILSATAKKHYQNFLSRIQTREDFQTEIKGKLLAVIATGYPLPIDEKNIDELISIMSLDTLGEPQVWPPNDQTS